MWNHSFRALKARHSESIFFSIFIGPRHALYSNCFHGTTLRCHRVDAQVNYIACLASIEKPEVVLPVTLCRCHRWMGKTTLFVVIFQDHFSERRLIISQMFHGSGWESLICNIQLSHAKLWLKNVFESYVSIHLNVLIPCGRNILSLKLEIKKSIISLWKNRTNRNTETSRIYNALESCLRSKFQHARLGYISSLRVLLFAHE